MEGKLTREQWGTVMDGIDACEQTERDARARIAARDILESIKPEGRYRARGLSVDDAESGRSIASANTFALAKQIADALNERDG